MLSNCTPVSATITDSLAVCIDHGHKIVATPKMQGRERLQMNDSLQIKGGGAERGIKNHSTHIQEPAKMTSQESYDNIVIKLKSPVTLKM